MPTRFARDAIASLTAYSIHLQLIENVARWRPMIDTTIAMLGCMSEEPETELILKAIIEESRFSSLHLSLLWPHLQPLTTAFLLNRDDELTIIGPRSGIVVLSGVQSRPVR